MGKLPASHILGLRSFIISISLAILPAFGWAAVESVTESFVASATSLPGSAGGVPRFSCFSLQMVIPAVYAGTVTSVGSGTIGDTGANWTQNQFNGTNGTFYAEFDSGWIATISHSDALTKTLSFTAIQPVAIAPGAAYRIRRHVTLADVFGPNNEVGLLGGQNSAEGDNVLLHSPETQVTHAFFYSTVPGFNGWYRDDYTPAAQLVIHPGQGIMIRRRSSPSLDLYLKGSAKEGMTLSPIYPGLNLVGTVKGSKTLRLSDLNLYTSNAATGVAGGSNPSLADNLVVINPDSTTATYFYSDYPGFQGWFDGSFRPSGTVMMDAGSAFFINRKAPRGAFYWGVPSE
jgi:hypothetical protein